MGVWRNRPISPLIADSYVVICYDCHFGMCPTSEKGKAISAWNTRKPMEKIVERLEDVSYWTQQTFDDDGFGNDDSERVIDLYKAIEIVKEELDAK